MSMNQWIIFQQKTEFKQAPQRFRMNLPEGGQGLPGGATAPYASVPPPPAKAANGCGSMPGSPTGSKKFSPLRR